MHPLSNSRETIAGVLGVNGISCLINIKITNLIFINSIDLNLQAVSKENAG